MIITELVIPFDITEQNQITDEYLPEAIRNTPFMWMSTIEDENVIHSLISRQWYEKLGSQNDVKPALGLYELLYLTCIRNDGSIDDHRVINGISGNYGNLLGSFIDDAMARYHYIKERVERREPESPSPRTRGMIDFTIRPPSPIDSPSWSGPRLEEEDSTPE